MEKERKRNYNPDYSQGKIYKLSSDQSDCFYIGATTYSLKRRFRSHKYRQLEGHTNIRIQLIEDCPCRTKYEFWEKEAGYIRKGWARSIPIVNQKLPGRDTKTYELENWDKVKVMKEAVRVKQKEIYHHFIKIGEGYREKTRAYYAEHRDHMIANATRYYYAHREKAILRMRETRRLKKKDIFKERERLEEKKRNMTSPNPQSKQMITQMLTTAWQFATGSSISAKDLDEIQDHCDGILKLINANIQNATAGPDVSSVEPERRERRQKEEKKTQTEAESHPDPDPKVESNPDPEFKVEEPKPEEPKPEAPKDEVTDEPEEDNDDDTDVEEEVVLPPVEAPPAKKRGRPRKVT